MKTWDLFDRLAQPTDAQSLVHRTLDAVLAFAAGRCAALFAREQERMTLFSSIAIEQDSLDFVDAVWVQRRVELLKGQALVDVHARSCTAVVPVMEGPHLAGILYVRTPELRFGDARDIDALAQFGRILAMVLLLPSLRAAPASPELEAYLERTPADELARQQLVVLLERNDWNIARVARLLGVTRATVYNRLRRLGLRRKPRPKADPDRQTA
jgi:hypothetical protein